jgi:8-oxo-dGTP pyrophosphatase MutT (NUDIX family)
MNKPDRVIPNGARLIPEEAKLAFTGEIFNVYQWKQKLFNNQEAIFEMIRRPDTVIIIPVLDDGSFVLCDEEQPGGVHRKDSFPIGRVEKSDETILDAAKRELLEETGRSFKSWKLVDAFQPENKIEWFIYVYVASVEAGVVDQKLDAGENIKTKKVNFNYFITKEQKKLKVLESVKSVSDIINLKEIK